MSKFYKINLDGKSYSLDESDYYELRRALGILKSIAFFDNYFETIVPGLIGAGRVDCKFSEIEYDYLEIAEEDEMFEVSYAYRVTLEDLYKKIGSYVSDDLKSLFCEDGVPYQLFYDFDMDLSCHSICTAIVDGEENNKKEKSRFISDNKEEFYFKYYEPLEKLVDLIENIDPFGLR